MNGVLDKPGTLSHTEFPGCGCRSNLAEVVDEYENVRSTLKIGKRPTRPDIRHAVRRHRIEHELGAGLPKGAQSPVAEEVR
jgi:hypothetical protein